MDLNTLLGLLLSPNSVTSMSEATGASKDDVKNVLASSLPDLLDGAFLQTKDDSTLDGFAGALSDHGAVDISDLASFFSGADLEDGGKIVTHLLGSNKKTTTAKAAKTAGVSDSKASDIISMAAPLLMSLLGQQTKSKKASNSSDVADIIGSLLGDADVSDLLVSLLGGGTTTKTTASGKKKTITKSTKNTGSGESLLSKFFGLFK